jgi:hypothetical protein
VVCWWVAQNLWNVSVYVADARAQLLPLVGGGEHDWNYLLGRTGWLRHDLLLARLVHLGGTLLFAWAMFQAWHHAADGATAERREAEAIRRGGPPGEGCPAGDSPGVARRTAG